MNRIRYNLIEWGADPDEAIRRVMDDELFYKKLLLEFADGEMLRRLQRSVESGQYKQAFQIAHEMKGAAANLSLTPLCAAVSNVVEDLRGSVSPTLDMDMRALEVQEAVLERIVLSS